jgi:small-conductance mechanosensitive channel
MREEKTRLSTSKVACGHGFGVKISPTEIFFGENLGYLVLSNVTRAVATFVADFQMPLTMKYVILLLKLAVFALLVGIRLGDVDVSWIYAHSKHRSAFDYYVTAIASIAIFLMFLDFVQFAVTRWYRRRHRILRDDNFIIGMGQIYSLLLVVGVVVGVLSLFRIDVRQLFTSLSIIFAGIAILTKDYISNMINGMIVTFSGQLSIGDNVRIGTHRGKIIDITLQNIHLLNDDDDVIYFPNALLLASEVVNYTQREVKRTSIDFEIDLRHLKTVEELERNLVEVLSPFSDLIKPDSYYLRVAEVKKDSVAMKFQYILNEPNKDLERQIRRRAIRRLVEIISEREKIADQIPDLPDMPGHAVI